MSRSTINLDIPSSAEERIAEVASKRVESISTQINRAIKFQREIIAGAEKEIQRLRGLYVHNE